MRQFLLAGLAAAALLGVTSAAHATFIVNPDPGGHKFFIDAANKDVSSSPAMLAAMATGRR